MTPTRTLGASRREQRGRRFEDLLGRLGGGGSGGAWHNHSFTCAEYVC